MSKPEQQRVIAYIDGFNLYYTIKYNNPNVKWLDIWSLCESFLAENQKLVGVKYFTAAIAITSKNDTKDNRKTNEDKNKASYDRQKLYWQALESTGVIIHKGRFMEKPIKGSNKYTWEGTWEGTSKYTCKESSKYTWEGTSKYTCKGPNKYTWEEKQTDVAIATQMIMDAIHDKYDIAFLVSGDNDFVPLVRDIPNIKHPSIKKKKVTVLVPPQRFNRHSEAIRPLSKHLRKAAEGKGKILLINIDAFQSHQFDKKIKTKKGIRQRPKEW